ncbi:MAG: GNAT family N-acetyltransferase [bacterium]|nr:GNAT family N-acetyltransferase [bacterium]
MKEFNGYTLKALSFSDKEMSDILTLLCSTFKESETFSAEYLKWLYLENPVGKAVGFNAFGPSGQLAAHYVTVPVHCQFDNKIVKGLLSLNTATHPEHQGKGLFVALAEETYTFGASLGYEFVYGVANQNSTHGFIKKLKFALVGALEARILILPPTCIEAAPRIARHYSQSELDWRLKNPAHSYELLSTKRGDFIIKKNRFKGTTALLKKINENFSVQALEKATGIRSPYLFIGASSGFQLSSGISWAIPHKFRPSPLNYIFRSINGKDVALKYSDVHFEALDFDAF